MLLLHPAPTSVDIGTLPPQPSPTCASEVYFHQLSANAPPLAPTIPAF